MAEVRRSAGAHFATRAPSSGMVSGALPRRAQDSGMAPEEGHIARIAEGRPPRRGSACCEGGQ
eukprot:252558-Lingulodinium_polyedra.AAC.1